MIAPQEASDVPCPSLPLAGVKIQQAEYLLEVARTVEAFVAFFTSAPSTGTFSDLHSTLEFQDRNVVPLMDYFDVDSNILNGHSDSAPVKRAVHRLAKVFEDTEQQAQLGAELDEVPDGKYREKFQMMAIVKHILIPMADSVVLNKREHFDEIVEKGGIKEDHVVSDQHKAAMSHLRTAQAKASNEPVTSYAPIARSLLMLEESDRVRMRNKFNMCYLMAKEGIAYEKYTVLYELEAHHDVDLGAAY